ncbi:hypothetical protein N7474_006194 [Penicillium riverlandense]|uniref:uncharacterized protein n=1 Tax=Penicillium riverlandense TaxID=1903569 RepID=UPI002548BC6B|nr:uncharacterized protein N7474_006194 [Penicillium riverlandense]KAJ5820603.1 hypothetical protein N7474_006194 [Penicillium riverlandense]
MPVSVVNSSAGNLSTQSALEAYTHAMQDHILFQISTLDSSENHEISDKVSDDVPTSGQSLQPKMPLSIFDSSGTSASNLLIQSAVEAYTHAMHAHTLSQVSSFDLSENHKIRDRVSDDVHTSGVLYQGPGPPNAAVSEEAARQAANGAELTQA